MLFGLAPSRRAVVSDMSTTQNRSLTWASPKWASDNRLTCIGPQPQVVRNGPVALGLPDLGMPESAPCPLIAAGACERAGGSSGAPAPGAWGVIGAGRGPGPGGRPILTQRGPRNLAGFIAIPEGAGGIHVEGFGPGGGRSQLRLLPRPAATAVQHQIDQDPAGV